jgi:PAS domain-containing protein
MPQSEFEAYFAELTRKLDALEAEVAASEFGKHFADLKRPIKILYEAMREDHLLLETVLENSAASIYAKRKDGRYTYLNHEMEALRNLVREQVLAKRTLRYSQAKSRSSGEPTTSRLWPRASLLWPRRRLIHCKASGSFYRRRSR